MAHEKRCSSPAALPGYDRDTALPKLLPLWPHEFTDTSLEGRRKVLANLRRALRAERRRGLAGHWTYDLAHHAALWRVYRCELADLEAKGGRPIAAPRARRGPTA